MSIFPSYFPHEKEQIRDNKSLISALALNNLKSELHTSCLTTFIAFEENIIPENLGPLDHGPACI